MQSDEIRESFLRFFQDRDHKRLPSSSLIPYGDPTLLFTSAGMVQFKPYLMGLAEPPARRLTTVQKVFRTSDIEEVGDFSHHTFFEMLGNFSIGDYFKREAIQWAWEYLTEVVKIPGDRLWATVFLTDDEAAAYWQEVGIPAERIVRYGEDKNYWFVGPVGPCGPNSEIYYDYYPERGIPGDPAYDDDRFVELWNLVFMTLYQNEDGSRQELPSKNIDTGAGLERLARVLQGKRNNYETDLLRPLIARVEALSGRDYGRDPAADRAMRVIADHSRAVTFLIADGVIPSNEGRGYVLRRVLRRAVYFGHTLGLHGHVLPEMVDAVVERMGTAYPELREQQDFVRRIVQMEEERFRATLDRGLEILDDLLRRLPPGGVIAGTDAFLLHDTYGVPVELSREVAAAKGYGVDLPGFEVAMAQQRERARAAARFRLDTGATAETYAELSHLQSRFVGYETLQTESIVVAIIDGGRLVDVIEAGQQAELLLRETPFYPEGGGQVGDRGEIRGPHGRFQVEDTQLVAERLIVHRGRMVEGRLSVNDDVIAQVNQQHRSDTMRNHTATHLLHAALREVLGPHVRQAGSLVAPDRLRFDFTHVQALTEAELERVQALVNEKIRANLPVRYHYTSFEQALAEGALAFFGEKYGDEVRVVEVPDNAHAFSKELCGGTHCSATGQIGFFLITSESSIGAGTRRIEALTGRAAEQYVSDRLRLLNGLGRLLNAPPTELERRITQLQQELEAERRQRQATERERVRRSVEELAKRAERVDGVMMLISPVAVESVDALREMAEQLRRELGNSVVLLGAVIGDAPRFVAMATPEVIARGVHAGDLLRQVAAVAQGSAGGRPEMAQGGGRDASKLGAALRLAEKLIRERLQAS